MWARLRSRLKARIEWGRVMRLYRHQDYGGFLEALEAVAEQQGRLTPYQRALKAAALLMVGKYKEALAIFALLSADDGPDRNRRYIALYARAMISDINGDGEGYSRNAAAASEVRAPYIVRLNLPL